MYKERSRQLERRGEGGARQVRSQEIVLIIPPQYTSTIGQELHSLLIGIGFTARPIASATLEALRQERESEGVDEWEEDEDEDSLPTKEYVLHNDPATVSRARAAAAKYGEEVYAMYSKERWQDVGKVKNLMDNSGYTLYDAVAAVLKANSRRSGAGSPTPTR